MDSGSPDSTSESGGGTIPADVGPLLARAGVASFRLTPTNEFAAVNDAFASLTGFSRADLLGQPFSTLVVADGGDGDGVVLPRTDGRSPTTVELSLRTADDLEISCTIHFQRLADDDRDEAGVVGLVERDLTDFRSTTDRANIAYGKTFAALAEAVPDGIIVLDTNSDVQYANPAVERILGYAPEELVGQSKVEIIPERLRQTHLDALQRYLETGEKHINWSYVELPGQHRDGREVPLGISLTDFTTDGDRYFVGLFRDISPRKEAERTLAEKAAQLESVAELGRRALATTDVDDLFRKATTLVAAGLDADYCKVLDLDEERDELLLRQGVGWDDGIVGEATVSATEERSQAGYTLGVDHPVVVEDLETESRFDGPDLLTDHGVRSGISVTIGPPNAPWGILGVHDAESREFADHDVDFVQSVATILATAIERERHERRLNETVAKLEESNERLEQFAYAASHDLQEPLRMISSYLQLVDRRYADELDEEGEEFIEYAVDGADRMREMIDGLLEYSRVETQGEPFEPVDCDALLSDVMDDLAMKVAERDAEITVESLPTAYGDERQLRQVFQNLLANAMEYSEDAPRIHVGVDDDGDEWVFSVSDDGIGIDPDDQDRIFTVFQRLHGHEDHNGTGIGLALCERIVERHGGEIRVDSEPGEGSTFFFTIPKR